MSDTKDRINKMLKKSEVILNAGKPQEMTNEEWLHTITADERVKEVLFRGFMTEKRTAEEFIEWLKEKHNE